MRLQRKNQFSDKTFIRFLRLKSLGYELIEVLFVVEEARFGEAVREVLLLGRLQRREAPDRRRGQCEAVGDRSQHRVQKVIELRRRRGVSLFTGRENHFRQIGGARAGGGADLEAANQPHPFFWPKGAQLLRGLAVDAGRPQELVSALPGFVFRRRRVVGRRAPRPRWQRRRCRSGLDLGEHERDRLRGVGRRRRARPGRPVSHGRVDQ